MPKKLEKQINGVWIDNTLSDDAIQLIEQLGGPKTLAEQIGGLLGNYRFTKQFRDTWPQPKKVLSHLESVIKDINRLDSRIDEMPEQFKSYADLWLYREKGPSYSTLKQQLKEVLRIHKVLYVSAVSNSKNYRVKVGKKNHVLEHHLLSEVSTLIESIPGIGLEMAAARAAGILDAAGIDGIPIAGKEYIGEGNRKKAREVVKEFRKQYPQR